MLFELINPSDPYTFKAPSLEVAAACAVLLSTNFGACCVDGSIEETTPVLFGWEAWLEDRGMGKTWFEEHASEIAEAYDSFLIGDKNKRADVESMLAMLPDEKKAEWRDQRQDRHRSSLNKIGERAYELAKHFRAKAEAC